MSEISQATNKELLHEVHVRQMTAEDVLKIGPVLKQWVRDPESGQIIKNEVEEIKKNMIDSVTGTSSERQYLIAEGVDGEPVGVMGMAFPSDEMKAFAQTEHPIEIVNAFVSDKVRGKGIGGQLLENVFAISKYIGATEVIVNSGPRYKDSAWDFYDKKFNGRVTTLKNKYGPGLDAPVWSKQL